MGPINLLSIINKREIDVKPIWNVHETNLGIWNLRKPSEKLQFDDYDLRSAQRIESITQRFCHISNHQRRFSSPSDMNIWLFNALEHDVDMFYQ